MKRIIGLILFLIGIAAIIWMNAKIFIDPISLVFVLLIGCSLTLIEYRKTFTRNDLIISIKKNMIFAGWIGMLIGTIYILSNFNQDNLNQVAGGFSVALISVLYGYILAYLAAFFSKDTSD